MITVLHFTVTGRFHCDGLGSIHPGLRPVRIGGGLQPGEVGCESCPRFAKCGMSHTSEIRTEIRDIPAILAAAKELGLVEPKVETVQLYDGKTYTGLAVRLKGWEYPVIIDTKTGALHYDNYNGYWGKEEELNKLKQMYGVCKATLIAKSKGYVTQRTTLSNGTIRLNVFGI